MNAYLVYIILSKQERSSRLADFVGDLQKLLQRVGTYELAFRSETGDVFGYFIHTEEAPVQIRKRLESLTSTRNDDVITIIELGSKFAAIGNSRAWTWLQHRLNTAA